MKNAHERFTAALKRLEEKQPTIAVSMEWTQLTTLIAHVQLALRHPDNKGWSSRTARKWCERVIAWIRTLEPDLAEALELGFHPEHDVKRDSAEKTATATAPQLHPPAGDNAPAG